jgi:hypothetical protein
MYIAIKGGPLSLGRNSFCVATDGDGHGVAGVMFDILDEEKVLA